MCLEFSTATPTRSPESFASVTGVTVNWGVIRTLLVYWKRQNKARVICVETLSRFWCLVLGFYDACCFRLCHSAEALIAVLMRGAEAAVCASSLTCRT